MTNPLDFSHFQHFFPQMLCADPLSQGVHENKMQMIEHKLSSSGQKNRQKIIVEAKEYDRIFLREYLLFSNRFVKSISIDGNNMEIVLKDSRHIQYPSPRRNCEELTNHSVVNLKEVKSLCKNPNKCPESYVQGRCYLKLIDIAHHIEKTIQSKNAMISVPCHGYDRLALKRAISRLFSSCIDMIQCNERKGILEIRFHDFSIINPDETLNKISKMKKRAYSRKAFFENHEKIDPEFLSHLPIPYLLSLNPATYRTWGDGILELICLKELYDLKNGFLFDVNNDSVSDVVVSGKVGFCKSFCFEGFLGYCLDELMWLSFFSKEWNKELFEYLDEIIKHSSPCHEFLSYFWNQKKSEENFHHKIVLEKVISPLESLIFENREQRPIFLVSDKDMSKWVQNRFLIEGHEWSLPPLFIQKDREKGHILCSGNSILEIDFSQIPLSFVREGTLITNVYCNGKLIDVKKCDDENSGHSFFQKLLVGLCQTEPYIMGKKIPLGQIDTFVKAILSGREPENSDLISLTPLLLSMTFNAIGHANNFMEGKAFKELHRKKLGVRSPSPQEYPMVEAFIHSPQEFVVIHTRKYEMFNLRSQGRLGELAVKFKLSGVEKKIIPTISIPYIYIEPYILSDVKTKIYGALRKVVEKDIKEKQK